MAVEFVWNTTKAISNFNKHGITFDEAATVFGDSLASTFNDHVHSCNELRFLTIGLSKRGKILVVSHTDRNGLVRIISARLATRREQKFYEEK